MAVSVAIRSIQDVQVFGRLNQAQSGESLVVKILRFFFYFLWVYYLLCFHVCQFIFQHFNPFAPGDFAEKRVLKLVKWFSGHCRAIKS